MECFKALLNRDSSKSSVHPSPKTRIDVILDSGQLNEPITREEVIQALKMAPTNKAVGIDSIDPSYSINQLLTSLFTYLTIVLRMVFVLQLGGKLSFSQYLSQA